MPRFEVYDDIHKVPERTWPLRLIANGDGSVTVVVVDNAGEVVPGGRLLRISTNGVTRVRHINPNIWLNLDGWGRVPITEVDP